LGILGDRITSCLPTINSIKQVENYEYGSVTWSRSALEEGEVWHSDDGDVSDGTEVSSLDWVIVGGESGPDARPIHPEWARSLRDQCVTAGVPFFFKQWGEWARSNSSAISRAL
jgi:Protein of unknown function (DUF5131)